MTDKEKNALEQLKQTYLTFETKHGDTSHMERLLLEQRRKPMKND